MTGLNVKEVGDQAIAAIKSYVTRELDKRVAALEARIKRLEDEDRPAALAYGGTWKSGQESKKNFFYTDRGSIWFCKESTADRPGETNAFVLAVKAGRDGRDAR
jgi:hypothetical protein